MNWIQAVTVSLKAIDLASVNMAQQVITNNFLGLNIVNFN